MSIAYDHLLKDVAMRYGVSQEQVHRRVQSRQATSHRLLGPRAAAPTVCAWPALERFEAPPVNLAWVVRDLVMRHTRSSSSAQLSEQP